MAIGPVAPAAAHTRATGAPAAATAPWTGRIDKLVKGHAISVVVGEAGSYLYRYRPVAPRTPASNEKLLLSMAILDELGPDYRMQTRAAAATFDGSVVTGDLWILGGGDPGVNRTRIVALAKALHAAGVKRITGAVRGSTGYFAHDWWAPGWKKDFPANEVALPTALTYNGNTANGVHIRDPERRAAVALTKRLRAIGIHVGAQPGAGKAPGGLTDIASVQTQPLWQVLRTQNVSSINFYAEVMGKLLGANAIDTPGTIAKGAEAIDAWAADSGVAVIQPYDSSGLSYDDTVTAQAVVKLLWVADAQSWLGDLRASLPHGGEGTLAGRLANVDVRAKTGTLTGISALSGWVQLEATGEWVEFSILSNGMPKYEASHIEDRIVTIVANSAA